MSSFEQRLFRRPIQRSQSGALFPLQGHHAVSEVLGVLFDLRQLGQGFLPNQKLLESGLGIAVQRLLDDFGQAPPFRRQSLADDGLQCVVTRANNPFLPQERHQFCEDEGRRDIAPDLLSGSFREQRHEFLRPRAIAEQPQNFLALHVILCLTNRPAAERLVGEIAPHEEVNVFLGHIGHPELEEGLFGFEIADLHNTRDLLGQAHTTLHQSALFRRKGEVLRALKVIEVRRAI